jgi:hypothetical protein
MSLPLIELSIPEARRAKWRAGLEKYGPVFVGHPIEHLDGELLDAMNYTEEARLRGIDMGDIPARLMSLCVDVRKIWRRKEKSCTK